MTKKYLILFYLIIFNLSYCFAQTNTENWDNKWYTNYSVENFKQLPLIHRKIYDTIFDYRLLDAAVFFRTNEERIKYNLPEFKFSLELEKTALGHSIDMVQNNFYSHESPVKGKTTLSDRLAISGIKGIYASENISDYNDADPSYWSLANLLVEGWMNSQGHRENILNPVYTYLGCGVWPYDNKEFPAVYFFKSTQNFCSNFSKKPIQITNVPVLNKQK